jgi:hypothetical protein
MPNKQKQINTLHSEEKFNLRSQISQFQVCQNLQINSLTKLKMALKISVIQDSMEQI